MPSQFLRQFLLFPALATFASAFYVDETIPSGTFTTESHLPSDSGNLIRSENGKVNFIQNNTWVAYDDFDFGVGATHFWVEGGSPNSGGTLEIWTRTDNELLELGPSGGQLIGSVAITNTGGFNTFQEFSTSL
ncbi:MAG: carbohydrate-binding protein, partial [Luteolibacter sp.]